MPQLSFCDTWGHWYVIGQATVGHRLPLQCKKTRECESVRRVTTVSLLNCSFLLTPSVPGPAEQFPVDRLSWESNILAPSCWTFRMVRNTLQLSKTHSLQQFSMEIGHIVGKGGKIESAMIQNATPSRMLWSTKKKKITCGLTMLCGRTGLLPCLWWIHRKT